MKKYLCILASVALLAACEQKTETVAPANPPAESKTEHNTTIVNPTPATSTHTDTHTTNVIVPPPASTPDTTTTSETTTTTTATATPGQQ